jgi:hypothetical protein
MVIAEKQLVNVVQVLRRRLQILERKNEKSPSSNLMCIGEYVKI